ncbi:MAG TPA: hypothetical protein VN066_08885 [Rhodocyclaceae bacterium]|nr:hypothetical protein [Rhodocyclaceae bacterium]
MAPTFPPIAELIAHRGNMLLLDRLLAADDESCSAEYTPRNNEWYADANGNMPAWIGIELMAQTIAAYVGMQKRSSGQPPKQGVLLGTRSYKTTAASYVTGAPLRIEARVSFRDESGLGAFECTISRPGNSEEALATAMLKVYEPEDFDAFIKGKQP